MKKLLIGACVAMLGIAAHASAVTWGLATGETFDSTKVNAGTMYLVYTADATGINWSALSTMSSYSADTIAEIGFEKTIATFEYSSTKINNKDPITPTSSGLAAGSHNMYMICIDDDGKNIAYTETPKAINVKATSLTVSATVLGTDFSYSEAVPEPTSGLLLLLGMGALALRRKQS